MAGRYARIAHRGFAAVGHENSLAAIEGALTLGADFIEVDVRLSRDGRIVLHHDNAETPGAPLLADALDRIAAAGAGVMLDLKVEGIAGAIDALLSEHAPAAPVIVSGRSREVLAVHRLRPSVRRGRTWSPRPVHGIPVLEQAVAWWHRNKLSRNASSFLRNFDVLVAHHRGVSHGVVESCHAIGREVYAWTVDEPRTVERMIAAGVDGIISDHPRSLGLSA